MRSEPKKAPMSIALLHTLLGIAYVVGLLAFILGAYVWAAIRDAEQTNTTHNNPPAIHTKDQTP